MESANGSVKVVNFVKHQAGASWFGNWVAQGLFKDEVRKQGKRMADVIEKWDGTHVPVTTVTT